MHCSASCTPRTAKKPLRPNKQTNKQTDTHANTPGVDPQCHPMKMSVRLWWKVDILTVHQPRYALFALVDSTARAVSWPVAAIAGHHCCVGLSVCMVRMWLRCPGLDCEGSEGLSQIYGAGPSPDVLVTSRTSFWTSISAQKLQATPPGIQPGLVSGSNRPWPLANTKGSLQPTEARPAHKEARAHPCSRDIHPLKACPADILHQGPQTLR